MIAYSVCRMPPLRAPSSQKTLKSVLLKVVSDFTLIQCSNENKKASSLFFICSQSVSSQGGSLTHISSSHHDIPVSSSCPIIW